MDFQQGQAKYLILLRNFAANGGVISLAAPPCIG
jgi:hypothetical protein